MRVRAIRFALAANGRPGHALWGSDAVGVHDATIPAGQAQRNAEGRQVAAPRVELAAQPRRPRAMIPARTCRSQFRRDAVRHVGDRDVREHDRHRWGAIRLERGSHAQRELGLAVLHREGTGGRDARLVGRFRMM